MKFCLAAAKENLGVETGSYEYDEGWMWQDDPLGLPGKLVEAARREEVGFMENKGVWSMRPIKECWDKTGKAPITVKWVDVNKGDEKNIIVRSRLCARDFKGNDKDRDDLFAASPPLEANRMLLSRAATGGGKRGPRCLLFIDVKKAHTTPRCEEDVYISLPEGVRGPSG